MPRMKKAEVIRIARLTAELVAEHLAARTPSAPAIRVRKPH
jgi:hypothetical protein